MAYLIRQDEAIAFRQAIPDPIARQLIGYCCKTVMISDHDLASDFDMLFFSRILEEIFRDREQLRRNLLGMFDDPMELSDNSSVP